MLATFFNIDCSIKNCPEPAYFPYKKCPYHRMLNKEAQNKCRKVRPSTVITDNGATLDDIIMNSDLETKFKNHLNNKINKYYQTDILVGRLRSDDVFISNDYIYNLILTQRINNCQYCEDKIFYVGWEKPYFTKQYSIDRINSALGHIEGNVDIICASCNFQKKDKTKDEFIFYKKQEKQFILNS